MTEELLGGGEPVVRLEAVEAALHDVYEEADGVSAVVGLLSDDLSESLGYGGWGLGLGEGPRPGVAQLAGCVVVDVVLGLFQAEFEELAGGVEPVVWLGVSELSLHGREEEADDESSVVGLFPDDLLDRGCVAVVVDSGVGAVPVGVRWREHMSYCTGKFGRASRAGASFWWRVARGECYCAMGVTP